MISSGTKRGLAAAAVSAMAVAGLPFLASSASADSGDTMSVLSAGPIRDGNAAGGSVIIKSSSDAIDPAKMFVTKADYSGTPVAVGAGPQITSPAYNVDVQSFDLLDGNQDGDDNPATGSLKFADGFYHYEAITSVTLGTAASASFGLVEDTGAAGVDAADAKTVVTVNPTGAPASVDIATTAPGSVVGFPTPFTVEVKDAAGNVTQLSGAETISITSPSGGISVSGADATLDASELSSGKASITGTPTTGGSQSLKATGATGIPASVTDTVTIQVYANATITNDEFALDAGADTWEDGVTAFGAGGQEIRVDQNSVTFTIKGTDLDSDGHADDAGKVVALILNSSTIKFNGEDSTATPPGVVVPILLDSDGNGSTTVALTNVTENSTFTFSAPGSGIATTTETMARAAATDVAPDANAYVTKIGSPTSVTVTVTDQFGNPVGAPAQVSITRGARNGSTTTARTTVDATGSATFSLPDAGTTAGSEVFTLNLYKDQFDASPTTGITGGTINYTVDGQGPDFGAIAATATITPLNDGTATPGSDASVVTISGGVPNGSATVSVDGGALLLTGSDTHLNKAAATKTVDLDGTGGATVTVVGTKFGTATVSIASGGRTKTVSVTVKASAVAADVVATARNVELEGPDKAAAGETTTFTATVTDAFGNPVPGVPVANLPLVVNGPANLQSSDAVTDAAGKLAYTVILTDNANSAVTARVTGVTTVANPTPQFGAAADSSTGTAKDAPGLTASVNTASATISNVQNVQALEQAVEDAQAAVDIAKNNVQNAQGDLNVAKAEKNVAKSEKKHAHKALKKAKKHHHGVNAAQRNYRLAKGDYKIAKAKVTAAKHKLANAKDTLAAKQADLAAAQQALEDAQSEG